MKPSRIIQSHLVSVNLQFVLIHVLTPTGLPEGCKVISTKKHAPSFWGQTGRIDVLLSDQTPKSFFIKTMSIEAGLNMVEGEFEAVSKLRQVLPDFLPRPVARGTCATSPDSYFYLSEFREMTHASTEPGNLDGMPDVEKMAESLATLHRECPPPESPNQDSFGFHIPMYTGKLPQYVNWEKSWETFFSKSMRQALDLEIERKGTTPELEALSKALFERVIPRLLRPLESEGRSVKPTLVHGDLWHANTGTDRDGRVVVFDVCGFYAHSECTFDRVGDCYRLTSGIRTDEFGQWQPAANKFGKNYIDAYLRHNKVSQPEEDFEDRLVLYGL